MDEHLFGGHSHRYIGHITKWVRILVESITWLMLTI